LVSTLEDKNESLGIGLEDLVLLLILFSKKSVDYITASQVVSEV